MGWVYDNGEPVPPNLLPKPTPTPKGQGQLVYDNGQPVPPELLPKDVPFPPGWRGQTLREMHPWQATVHGMFAEPEPGELNPTAQRLEDWLTRQGGGVERLFPTELQSVVHPFVQPATPTEAAVTGVGGFGTGAQGVALALGQPELIPVLRKVTTGAQLATALAGGALEARPGHRVEMAENEAIKTGLGLVLAKALHIPFAPIQPQKPLLRTFAPTVGRVGVPWVLSSGPDLVKGLMRRAMPAPEVVEIGGEGGEGAP